jgi:hypothetical protein
LVKEMALLYMQAESEEVIRFPLVIGCDIL